MRVRVVSQVKGERASVRVRVRVRVRVTISTLLTFCPPAPPERVVLISSSSCGISTSPST